MHEHVCKTILWAQKSVHANIKFVKSWIVTHILCSWVWHLKKCIESSNKNIPIQRQVKSSPYENHCKCYKKLIKIRTRAIYTYLSFFLYIQSPLLLENKKITVIAVFLLTKLDHRPLLNYIFSYFHKNHCKCYKKLASRSGPILFTLTYFFLIHKLSSSTGK